MSTKPNALANPGPLGLLGFGMTTILLNLHNAELIQLSVVIVAMGFALGGLAQIIAGIFELRNGNTFGGTAFTAYGCFWWSLIFIWVNPTGGAIAASDAHSMGAYLLLWAIFTGFMFIGTLKHNKATQVVFGTLTLLFLLLAIADFSGIHGVHLAAGWVGIICGASAIYASMGQVLNAEYGKNVMPLG
ncbi:MAG: acetate uptake transporter [Firmicutes bacterium]|nr:acetate uptake transporter [Bacillota bacterium]